MLDDSYASRTVLKRRLGIPDTNIDAKLNGALASAAQSIERTCGRPLNDVGVASARVYPNSPRMVSVDDLSGQANSGR